MSAASAADAKRAVSEGRTTALQTLETELKAAIGAAQTELDALKASIASESVALAKSTADRKVASDEASTAAQAVADAAKELVRLQTAIASTAADLKAVVYEHGKTVRDSEAMLTEIALH